MTWFNEWIPMASALHYATCLYMTGVIWVIQTLHYPAFELIGEPHFTGFHARHTRLMGFVVGPVMCIELGTAVVLASRGGAWVLNLAAVIALFAATFGLSVPLHNRLARGGDPELVRRLVRTNWPRTLIWSARAVVFVYLLAGEI